jgi:hypothetical protein
VWPRVAAVPVPVVSVATATAPTGEGERAALDGRKVYPFSSIVQI